MELNYNTISLIDTLGLIQGIVLGILLLFTNKKSEKPTIFLGLFIIAYALDLLPEILIDINATSLYPNIIGLPVSGGWLLFPLFYVYVQRVSIFSKERINYWVLYPGIVSLILQSYIFLKSPAKRLELLNADWYVLLHILSLIYCWYIGVLTVRWINKHITEIGNQYTNTKFKELRWAKLYVILGLAITLAYALTQLVAEFPYQGIVFSVINVILLYWISLRGILQTSINAVIPTTITEIPLEKVRPKKFNEKEDSKEVFEQQAQLAQRLDRYLEDSKVYVKPDITIVDIAEALSVHPRKLSTTINAVFKQNFNTHINTFRIENVKVLLNSETSHNLSIEGIGIESGFNSKSSFYAAFKKEMGCTPLQYKKRL